MTSRIRTTCGFAAASARRAPVVLGGLPADQQGADSAGVDEVAGREVDDDRATARRDGRQLLAEALVRREVELARDTLTTVPPSSFSAPIENSVVASGSGLLPMAVRA